MAIPYDPVNDFFGGINKPAEPGTPSGGSVVNDFFSKYPTVQVTSVQPATPQAPVQQTGIFNQARTFIEQMGKKLVEKVVPQKLPSGNILKITLPSKITEPKKTGLQSDLGQQKVSAPSAIMTEEGRFRYSEEGQAQIFKKTQEEIKSKVRPVKPGYKEPGIFGSIVESIKEGTVSMFSGLGATTEMVGKMTGQMALIEAGQKIFKESEKILASNPEWGEAPDAKWSPTKIARLVAGAAPSLLATTAAMLATGGTGALAVAFGMEAGQTYKESKEAGVPEGKAQLYGTVVGTINAILEKAFPEKLLTPVKGSVKETVQKISKSLAKDVLEKAAQFGVRVGKSGMLEGSTEALQQLWSNVIAINYDKNRSLWSGLLESFVGGFGSGGIVGGVVQEQSLPPGEYTAQEVIDKVISSPLQDTPEGKALLKSALEAKQQDKNIVIEKSEEKIEKGETQSQNLEPQKKDGWCGPTALQYALKDQGISMSQESLAKGMGATVENGADPKQIKTEAEKQGIQAQTIQGEDAQVTLTILDKAISEGKSVILDFLDGKDINNDGHYVLYQGRSNGKITVIDPQTAKPRQLDEQYFIDQWKDTTIRGTIFKRWAMILEKSQEGTPIQKLPVYFGSEGKTKKSYISYDRVLSVNTNQSELIKTLADEGNEKAQQLYESMPNKKKVDFTIADPIIREAYKDQYDAIQYKNNAPELHAQGITYFDTKTGRSYAENKLTAEQYARMSRKEKYAPIEGVKTVGEVAQQRVEALKQKQGKVIQQNQITVPSKEQPVGTGKSKNSRLFERIKDTLGSDYETKEIKYNELSLEGQAEKVVSLISEDPEKAVRIARGYEEPPAGMTQNAVAVALAETARAKGDYITAARLWVQTSLRSTRLGQEIVSLRGDFSINEPLNAVKKLLNSRMDQVTRRYSDIIKGLALPEGESMVKKVDALVKQEAKKLNKVLTKAQKNIQSAQEIINALKCK